MMYDSAKLSIVLLVVLGCAITFAVSLRTGAPSLACLSLRPIHGLHRARPASASQFFVSQSSFSYQPGQNISVDVVTHSTERYFRGFIVQAYDPITGAQIGNFAPTIESRPLESCSAATHRNNLNKKQTTLIWMPPIETGSGLDSVSGQWLGIRTPRIPQPRVNWTMDRKKRQSPDSTGTIASPPIGPNSSTGFSGITSPQVPSPGTNSTILTPNDVQNQRQVRFKASIVVTYDEFYTGFESSDQTYAKWDFAKTS